MGTIVGKVNNELPENSKGGVKLYVIENGRGKSFSRWSDNYICELKYFLKRINLMIPVLAKNNFKMEYTISPVLDTDTDEDMRVKLSSFLNKYGSL